MDVAKAQDDDEIQCWGDEGEGDLKLPPQAAAPPAASKKKKQPEVIEIDLTATKDDENNPASLYEANIVKSAKKSRPKKRTRTSAAAALPSDHVDAIVVDDTPSASSSDPAARYRQALGPLRFDFVETLRKHSFDKVEKSSFSPKLNLQKVYQELLEYKLNLPVELSSSVFVRAQEGKMNLLRALITGPEDTPYGFGCFLFDIDLGDYPRTAPKVKFLTTGGGKVRFNPNLYNCGKVCLSLLGTWTGPGWIANKSTLLQVLVSIQGLILVPDPYFNEPGYERDRGTAQGKKLSSAYSANIRRQTMQHGMCDHLKQVLDNIEKQGRQRTRAVDYPEFFDVIERHFYERADAIREQIAGWVAEDSTLNALADRVYGMLDELKDKCDSQKAAAKPAPKPAPVVLTIDD